MMSRRIVPPILASVVFGAMALVAAAPKARATPPSFCTLTVGADVASPGAKLGQPNALLLIFERLWYGHINSAELPMKPLAP